MNDGNTLSNCPDCRNIKCTCPRGIGGPATPDTYHVGGAGAHVSSGLDLTFEEKCCEECYDVHYEKTWPEHTAYPACINLNCKCHTPKEPRIMGGMITKAGESKLKFEEERPMTKGEAEIAAGLDKHFEKAEAGEWRERFDRDFDWLNARHTNEQWDAYKDFIATELQRAYEEREGFGRADEADRCEKHEKTAFEAGKQAMREELRAAVDNLEFVSSFVTGELREAAKIGWTRALVKVIFLLDLSPKKHYEDKGFGSAFDKPSE